MYIPELVRKECMRRGLSINTIKTYNHCIKRFFHYYGKDPKKVKKADVVDFLDRLIEKRATGSTLNVHLNALKFLYGQVFNKKIIVNVRFSKKPKRLPTVLTKEEIKRLFNGIKNPKHKLMAELMYSAGLRVNELVNLKIEDLEFSKNYGWVRKGKGNKDRLFIIANNIKEKLNYFIKNSKNGFLFNGNNNWHISIATVQKIIKKAAKKAAITKRVHPHTLRHSFATHLIENGYDVNAVQSLLGHSSSETTMTYVHMASPKMLSIRSPYDEI